jgi:hypothetical protein
MVSASPKRSPSTSRRPTREGRRGLRQAPRRLRPWAKVSSITIWDYSNPEFGSRSKPGAQPAYRPLRQRLVSFAARRPLMLIEPTIQRRQAWRGARRSASPAVFAGAVGSSTTPAGTSIDRKRCRGEPEQAEDGTAVRSLVPPATAGLAPLSRSRGDPHHGPNSPGKTTICHLRGGPVARSIHPGGPVRYVWQVFPDRSSASRHRLDGRLGRRGGRRKADLVRSMSARHRVGPPGALPGPGGRSSGAVARRSLEPDVPLLGEPGDLDIQARTRSSTDPGDHAVVGDHHRAGEPHAERRSAASSALFSERKMRILTGEALARPSEQI